MVVAGVFFLGIVIITPLDLVSQALFAALTIIVMLLIRGQPSRGVTLVLVTLSIVPGTTLRGRFGALSPWLIDSIVQMLARAVTAPRCALHEADPV